jgi:hypothetical protein
VSAGRSFASLALIIQPLQKIIELRLLFGREQLPNLRAPILPRLIVLGLHGLVDGVIARQDAVQNGIHLLLLVSG